jgi:DNA polymerase-1
MMRILGSTEDVADFWTWLSELDRVSVDTETSSVHVYEKDFRVRLIQFGTRDSAWVIPFEEWRGLIRDVFTRFTGTFVFHNSRFDISALHQCGIKVRWSQVEDTMIMIRLAEPTESAALKKAAVRHVGAGAGKSQKDLATAMRTNKWTWDTIPIDFPAYTFYAAQDVILTSRLYESDAAQEGRRSPAYDVEMQVRSICTTMERNGMAVDTDRCQKYGDDYRERAGRLRDWALDTFDLELGSLPSLARWFLDRDVRLWKTTRGGAPSLDQEALESIIASYPSGEVHEVAAAILEVRALEKIASTYFYNFINMQGSDGRLHPDIETVQARTGRMSIRNPALQTLPRVSSDPKTRAVREVVVPREEHHVIVTCDSDQIELRMAAILAGDKAMMQAFRDSDDFFTTLMQEIYRDPDAVKSDPRRANVKTTMYAKTYGAGDEQIAFSAGVPVVQIKELLAKMALSYPEYTTFAKKYEREARDNNGWVVNPYGRRLQVDAGREYTATNYVIQSGAADVLKRSIINIAHAGLEDYMIVPVHDEIVLSVPEDEADEVKHLVDTLMTCNDFDLTLTASSGTPAKCWADAK